MRSWFLQAPKNFDLVELEQLPFDASDTERIKVRIRTASLSATDIELYLGTGLSSYPIIPVKCATGLVSESNVAELKKGQRLYLSSMPTQGKGEQKGLTSNGYLCDFCLVPLSHVHPLPDGVSDERAVFIEDIAKAIAVIEQLDIEKTKYIALFGASSTNIIIGQLALYYQAIPIIIDDDVDRLALAEECGIYYTINAKEEDPKQRMIELTSGNFADYGTFDSDCFASAKKVLHLLAYGGKLCIFGEKTHSNPIEMEINKLALKMLTVYGLVNGRKEIPSAINLLAMNVVNVSSLIARRVNFDQVPLLFSEESEKTAYLKTIIQC